MPLNPSDEGNVKRRLTVMFMDTTEVFRLLSRETNTFFNDKDRLLQRAIDEYLMDFVDETNNEDRKHPEALILETDRVALQMAGFYGAQLDLKERQVRSANASMREAIKNGARGSFMAPFKNWVNVINNFLNSLGVTGVGEALKELKDCLRDELPDE